MDVEKNVEEKKLSSIMNSIQIALDGYDDIFSDFDPSPYNKRILSDDLIKEMQKRYIETKKGEFEVRFSLPSTIRDPKTETLIKKRLKDYFSHQIKEVDIEINDHKNRGIKRIALGAILLSIEIIGLHTAKDFVFDVISVLTVPAGWYGMYSGYEYLFDQPARMTEQRKFMKKFHDANYLFVSEEELVKNLETTSDQQPLEMVFDKKAEETKKDEIKKPSDKK